MQDAEPEAHDQHAQRIAHWGHDDRREPFIAEVGAVHNAPEGGKQAAQSDHLDHIHLTPGRPAAQKQQAAGQRQHDPIAGVGYHHAEKAQVKGAGQRRRVKLRILGRGEHIDNVLLGLGQRVVCQGCRGVILRLRIAQRQLRRGRYGRYRRLKPGNRPGRHPAGQVKDRIGIPEPARLVPALRHHRQRVVV